MIWLLSIYLAVVADGPEDSIADEYAKRYPTPIQLDAPHISTDESVKYDFDIVYIRVPREGDNVVSKWPEIANPVTMDPGGDLMLLHPDGTEELLVAGGVGSITDPMVSLDGEWVFYSQIHDMTVNWAGKYPRAGADIFKIHLQTREVIQLTRQQFTPNTGAADWAADFVTQEQGKTYLDYGVFNMGPCPLPDGRIVFTSNRNAFIPPDHRGPTLQLFVMDDDGTNVECIGHFNLGNALHPIILQDGRIVFSSLESQGLRNTLLWGLWSIHPDGSNWGPVISAFDTGGAPNAFHFQTQLSDSSIVAEEYYNQNNSGFGAYLKLPPSIDDGVAPFGPAFRGDPRNPALRFGRFYNSKPKIYRLPFSPIGTESLTRFANNGEGAADLSILGDAASTRVGKFTHPSSAPDNHLLTVYSPGPANHQNGLKKPSVDGGLYLIKDGKAIDEPGQMRLIKNDPRFNEQFPRAVVSYLELHGIQQPRAIPPLRNDGISSEHLPESTPFGLIGTSSLYKRESYPEGQIIDGSVTATAPDVRDPNGYQRLDPFNTSQNGASLNWFNQGADAGRYENNDIHALRILLMEPTTDRHRGPNSGRRFYSHAAERLRILGEIPVRKFDTALDEREAFQGQPVDPDGNADTSFLAKIPADTPFTFQTIDRNGMVLNMSQTWHQLRPGEIRHDCGGCHAHSQEPTSFLDTFAASPEYNIFDLTESTPLITDKASDESGRRWDVDDETGLAHAPSPVLNVEYFRDIKPILARSCIACHHSHDDHQAAGNLDLDADDQIVHLPNEGQWPATYYRLAADDKAKFGHPPVIHNRTWRQSNASRYIRKFQSRRSLLVWKIYGARLDGWHNSDFPTARIPGDPDSLEQAGLPVENTQANRDRSDLDYNGASMPPREAVVDGTVEPLSDQDRRTLVRWIDLGCPIDYDYDPDMPDRRGYGWMCDDLRPTLTLTSPRRGENRKLTRVAIGYYDAFSGIAPGTLSITADFEIDGHAPGTELRPLFTEQSSGVITHDLAQPIHDLEKGTLVVSVKDRQGNLTKIERTFSVE